MSDDLAEDQGRARDLYSRKRRFLLATSVTFALVLYFKIDVEKINLLGNDLPIQRKGFIAVAIGILWVYAAWRCHQFRREVRDDYFRFAVEGRVGHYLKKRAVNDLAPEVRAQLEDHERAQVTKADATWDGTFTKWTIRVDYDIFREAQGSAGHRTWGDQVTFHRPVLGWLYLKARVYVLFHSYVFTEYHLPWVVAALTLLVLIWRIVGARI